MNHALFTRALVRAGLAALGAVTTLVAADREPRWEAFVGVGYRSSVDLTLHGAARTSTGALYDAAADQAALVAAAGALNANVARSYDNGAVGAGSALGVTTNWSYQSASQVGPSSQNWDSSGTQSLYYTRNGALALQSADSRNRARPDAAPLVELRRLWTNRNNTERGLALAWTTLRAKTNTEAPLVTTRTQLRDEYFLYGVIPPTAPYTGPAQPPGPLLDNRPHARTFVSSATGTSGTMRTNAKAELQTFSLGALWRSGHRTDRENGRPYFDLQAGATANFVEFTTAQHATVLDGAVSSTVRDDFARRTTRVGYYASADLALPLNATTAAVLRARYDHLTKLHFRSPNISADAALSGWSIYLGISKRW